MAGQVDAVACCGVEVEPDEEENGPGDVDEGVDAVCPVHEEGVAKEPCLDGEFVEDVQALLEVDELEGVAACDVHGAFDHCYGAKGAAELVYLRHQSLVSIPEMVSWSTTVGGKRTQYIKAQYHASTRNGNFLSSLLKKYS